MMNAGRWYPTNTTLANGDVLVVSGDIDPTHVNMLPQIWQNAGGGWRDLATAQLALPLYPFMFLAPDGRVFQAGPNQNTRYLDTSETGGWTAVANSIHGYRDYGSAVLYDQGKVRPRCGIRWPMPGRRWRVLRGIEVTTRLRFCCLTAVCCLKVATVS